MGENGDMGDQVCQPGEPGGGTELRPRMLMRGEVEREDREICGGVDFDEGTRLCNRLHTRSAKSVNIAKGMYIEVYML
jgi:hypothetical protein